MPAANPATPARQQSGTCHDLPETAIHPPTNLHIVMGMQSFEDRMERMVGGVFSRGSRPSVRPVDIGRRMLREIDDHRSVDVNGRRIVPNQFVIELHPSDHRAFADVYEALLAELAETVREYARSEGYHFVGAVQVELVDDHSQKPGRFAVVSGMRESTPAQRQYTLVLDDGATIDLGREHILIGRHAECTVAVADGNVSRRHAEVRPVGTGYAVADLGSTNGTRVNGIRIQGERSLDAGDVITVGNCNLRFEAT